MKICGIYLGDAAIKNNLGGTYVPTASADFEFRGCVYSTEPDATALGGLFSQVTLADHTTYSTVHTFYAFPNPTVADSAASTWNARHTHLIIQVLIDDTTKYYNIPKGFRVKVVNADSAAEEAGIKVNDIIIGIEGKLIESIEEFNSIKNQHKAGETVKISVYRNGEIIDLDVTLKEAANEDESAEKQAQDDDDLYDRYRDFFNQFY